MFESEFFLALPLLLGVFKPVAICRCAEISHDPKTPGQFCAEQGQF